MLSEAKHLASRAAGNVRAASGRDTKFHYLAVDNVIGIIEPDRDCHPVFYQYAAG